MATVPVHLTLFGVARELANLSERNIDVPSVSNHRQLRQLIFHEALFFLSALLVLQGALSWIGFYCF